MNLKPLKKIFGKIFSLGNIMILKKIKYLNDEKNRISKLISDLDLLKFHLEIVNDENYVSDESVAHLNSIHDDLKNFEISR